MKGASAETLICTGSCHCGAVKFTVRLPLAVEAWNCNCSICRKSGFVHVIAGPEDFSLDQGEDLLQEYRFNTGLARHLFCRICGVKSFYRPRSHPQDWSINLNCLDLPARIAVSYVDFDGKNWETAMASRDTP